MAQHVNPAKYSRTLLREARERKGWKQRDVALRLGYSAKSASTIKKWESGERDVPSQHLAELATLYGVPPHVFVHPEPTAEERLNELARGAIGLALDDLAAGEGPGRDGDARPDEPPSRRRQ